MDTIAENLLARAGDTRVGLVAGDGAWTWNEVVDASRARATWLAAHRAPGPFHVALLLDNVPEFAFWLGAAALAGAVTVGANPTHRGVRPGPRPGPHPVPAAGHRPGPSPAGRRARSGDRPGRGLGRQPPGPDRRRSRPARAARRHAAACSIRPRWRSARTALGYLIFTSGTSGAPKACRCTQGRLARIGAAVAQIYEITADDVCYVAMPLFHSNALMAGWSPTLAAGATLALPSSGRFSASGFLADVRRHGVTYFNYVGKPLSYILATPERPDDADNTLTRVFGNEGAEDDLGRFATASAAGWSIPTDRPKGAPSCSAPRTRPAGALGRAPDDTVIIDPATGDECPVARFDADGRLTNAEEAIGELVSKSGAAGFEGYWDNNDAEEARLRNGWYWTGDLAYRDDKGFFYFAGRSDDWLRVDGENFAAAPVGRILQRHPDVVLAVVYAVPDPVTGDQVMAALQLRPGAVFDPDAFAAFLAAQSDMGTKWAPRFVRVSDALPITATSKVLTRTLRAEAWRGPDPVWWSPRAPPAAATGCSSRPRWPPWTRPWPAGPGWPPS